MAAPGVTVTLRDSPTARGVPTDTGAWFICGLTQKGPTTTPVEIHSLAEYVTTFGSRETDSPIYDAVDAYFREGGAVAYVSRVVGPAALQASKTLNDSGAQPSLTVKAKTVGTWGNNLKIAVTAGDTGGEFKLVVTDATTSAVLETSPSLADVAAAVTWGATATYVTVVSAGANDPNVAAATALLSGTDDRASVTDAHWQTALDKFTILYGPGQVSYPGRTTSAAHLQLEAHAGAYNRVAVLDAPDTPTVATLTSLATTDRATPEGAGARRAGLFAPWVTISGITAGTTRTIPPSAIQAGMLARVDREEGPQRAAAGEKGASATALGVSQSWTDSERDTLNTAGVNVIRSIPGLGVRTYGQRSLASPSSNASWLYLPVARVVMAVYAQAEAIAEKYMFRVLDGKGHTISEFGGELSAMLLNFHRSGALYGDAPADAYRVDVSDAVNTPTTIAAGQLRAVLSFRVSGMAEYVQVELVKQPLDSQV